MATLAISYSAGTGNYTVSVSGRSLTVGAAQLDASLSAGEANIYTRALGDTTDSLSLSKNSTAAGTAARPEFRYVSGGVWQRTIQSADSISGTADAFAYGVATPAAAMPTTGTANYAVILRGIGAFSDVAVATKGNGSLSVNFSTGALGGSGTLSTLDPTSGLPNTNFDWVAGAQIASGTGTFSGGINFAPTTVPAPGSNRLVGRFYGLGHEELGASWFWSFGPGGPTLVGYMLGKDKSLLLSNGGLDSLVADESFASTIRLLQLSRYNTNGNISPRSSTDGIMPGSVSVSYDEIAGALKIDGSNMLAPLSLIPSLRDSVASLPNFDAYHTTRQKVYNVNNYITEDLKVWIFKPGSANTQLALTYTGFGYWQVVQPDFSRAPIYDNIEIASFAFGRKTPNGSVPTTGSATYNGMIYGSSAAVSSASMPYVITGDATLTYDFAAPSFSGSMHPFATNPISGTKYDLGAYAFGGNSGLSVGSSTWFGNFTKSFTYIQNNINGQFTGPTSQEFYAGWQTGITDPVNGGDLAIIGIMVGKK